MLENVETKSNLAIETSDIMDNKLNDQIMVISNSVSSFKKVIGSLEEIIPRINTVSNNILNIGDQKDDIIQSVGATASVTEQVSTSSEQIAASSQQLSESSQEIASSMQNLIELSRSMIKAIEQFKI